MKTEPNNIYQGDCLEVMKYIPDGSIDLILEAQQQMYDEEVANGTIQPI